MQMSEQIRAGQLREVAFRNSLAESQEHERTRIAREVHDDTIQTLVVVGHHLERAATSAGPNAAEQVHLRNARQTLFAAINGLRDLIAGLRPTMLDELGIAAALETLCAQHPHAEFKVVGTSRPLDAAHELALFRTAQEALRNAERYANAQQIAVTLTYSDSGVVLDVRDDGVGFEVPQQLRELTATGHFGLFGIRERLLHLGGSFGVSSERQHGTHLRAAFVEGLELAAA
jgi:two-component system sensor histidine kinase UhpB